MRITKRGTVQGSGGESSVKLLSRIAFDSNEFKKFVSLSAHYSPGVFTGFILACYNKSMSHLMENPGSPEASQ